MEYKGKLYGKVGNSYFPLDATSDDFDGMQKNIEQLKQKLQIAEKALNQVVNFNEELQDEFGDPGELANSALEKIMVVDGF